MTGHRWPATSGLRAAWCAGLLLLVPVSGLRAQEPRALTLEECLRLALEQNPRLRAAAADATAAAAAARRVGAARWPQLRAQASYTRLSGNIPGVEFTLPGLDSTITFQGVELNRWQSELTLEVPLLSQLRLGQESRAATHEAAAAAALAEQERADVAFEIRRAYWSLERALAARAGVDAAIERVEQHLEVVRQRMEAGAALRRDLLAAQTRRSEVRLERVEADNASRTGELELNRLLGLPLDTPVRPVTSPERADSAAEQIAAGVAIETPALASLQARVRALGAQLRAAGAARVPELDLLTRYVYARPNPYFFTEQDRFRGSWELGLSARLGLWEGGRTGARRAEVEAQLAAAEARLADAREQAEVAVARQRLELRRAAEAVVVAAQNVAEAEESFRVVRQQFDEGVALAADVLAAEEALRRARVRSITAQSDRALARAAVLHALGQVW